MALVYCTSFHDGLKLHVKLQVSCYTFREKNPLVKKGSNSKFTEAQEFMALLYACQVKCWR